MSAKNWCFTVNNYLPEDEVLFKELPGVTYLVYGREVGAEGTPHLQGFVVFAKVMSLRSCKLIHATCHWERSKGSAQQNRVYCTKDNDYIETGLIPASAGARASLGGEVNKERWDAAKEAVINGSLEDVPSDILIGHYGSIKRIRADFGPRPKHLEGELEGVWYWGIAGCGKSRRAHDENPDAYIKNLTKWWDGYEHEPTVIIDDMDPYHKAFGLEFKIWSDRYVFQAEFKGGMFRIRPKKIVVTSQYSIDEVWDDELTRAAMHRRFTETCLSPDAPPNPPRSSLSGLGSALRRQDAIVFN
nr:MAG: replication associated protein [Cressdnaviricota sp.]